MSSHPLPPPHHQHHHQHHHQPRQFFGSRNNSLNTTTTAAAANPQQQLPQGSSTTAPPHTPTTPQPTLTKTLRKESSVRARIHRSHNAFETIDFEEPDGEFLRKHYKTQTNVTLALQEFTQYLLAAIITFIIASLFYGLFIGTELIGELRIRRFSDLVHQNKVLEALAIAIWTSLIVTLIPAFLIIAFAPDAIGSGMSDVIAYLNGSQTINGGNLLLPAVRYLGTFGIVVGGLFSGIDGPMARIGAAVSIFLTRLMRNFSFTRYTFYGITTQDLDSANTDLKKRVSLNALLDVLEQQRLRIFATIGAAVAITVIFRAPLGGVMFALEETTSFYEPSMLIRTLFSTIIGHLILSSFIRNGLQSDTDMYIKPALYPVEATCTLNPSIYDYFTYILVGLGAAVLGTLWNTLLAKVQNLRIRYLNPTKPAATISLDTRWWKRAFFRLFDVALLSVVTNVVVVLVPMIEGLDPCVDLSTPLEHVEPTMPAACVKSMTDAREEVFSACLETITNVCVPNNVMKFFIYNLVRYRVIRENPTLNITTLGPLDLDTSPYLTRRSSLLPTLYPPDTTLDPTTLTTTLLLTPSHPNPLPLLQTLHQLNSTSPLSSLIPTLLADPGLILYLITDAEGSKTEETASTCYHPLRTLLFATPDKQLRLLLRRGVWGLFSPKVLAVFLVLYLTCSLMTYYIALPTDLVIPNLILGAVGGRLVGLLVNSVKGGRGRTLIDPGLFAMIGMSALWSGTSRLALTVTVITLELTGDIDNLTPLLIVSLTATFTTTFLHYFHLGGSSLYHTEMKGLGVLFLPHEPDHKLRTIPVSSVAKMGGVVCLRERGTVEDAKRCLETKHHGFAVVREEVVEDDGGFVSPVSAGSIRSGRSLGYDGIMSPHDHVHGNHGQRIKLRPIGMVHRTSLTALMEGMVAERRQAQHEQSLKRIGDMMNLTSESSIVEDSESIKSERILPVPTPASLDPYLTSTSSSSTLSPDPIDPLKTLPARTSSTPKPFFSRLHLSWFSPSPQPYRDTDLNYLPPQPQSTSPPSTTSPQPSSATTHPPIKSTTLLSRGNRHPKKPCRATGTPGTKTLGKSFRRHGQSALPKLDVQENVVMTVPRRLNVGTKVCASPPESPVLKHGSPVLERRKGVSFWMDE
ncbi:chloride channel [Chytridium lagenaria]|nr:chloride channel [Chytridium lagenaria]